jgi:hypothetical protein
MRLLLVILCSAAALERDALAAPIRTARTHSSFSIDGRTTGASAPMRSCPATSLSG